MSKSSKVLAFFPFLILFILIWPQGISAHHVARVLGASTSSETASIPPTVEGPGFILPDSPLYFLDQFKQSTRVLFSFTPETKAKVYREIAGERMAELRLMLAKNNSWGVETSISGVTDNLKNASESLNDAALTGRNVSTLARKINDDIKAKMETFGGLESKGGAELKARAKAASISLLLAKVKAEDSLPEDELENEIEYDMNFRAQKEVRNASLSVEELESQLEEIQKQTKDSRDKVLKKREEVLKKAIEEKNELAQKQAERDLNIEKKKQEALLKVNQAASDQAREAVVKAKAAAKSFAASQQQTLEIKRGETTVVLSKEADKKEED